MQPAGPGVTDLEIRGDCTLGEYLAVEIECLLFFADRCHCVVPFSIGQMPRAIPVVIEFVIGAFGVDVHRHRIAVIIEAAASKGASVLEQVDCVVLAAGGAKPDANRIGRLHVKLFGIGDCDVVALHAAESQRVSPGSFYPGGADDFAVVSIAAHIAQHTDGLFGKIPECYGVLGEIRNLSLCLG